VCPELPGCASAGDAEEEARSTIREAIQLYLEPSDIPLPEDAKLAEVTIAKRASEKGVKRASA